MKKLALLLILLCSIAHADQGMTSSTHATNVGKIVFSTKEIVFKKENPSQFASTIKLGQPIFGRLYFKQAMVNTPLFHRQGGAQYTESYRTGHWEILVSVDGKNHNVQFDNYAQGKVSHKAENVWTSWQMNLQPDGSSKPDTRLTDPWIKLASGLSPGNHEIKVSFVATMGDYRSKPMAEGSFTLAVAKGATFSAGAFPTSTYKGSDVHALRGNMKRALVGPVAKSSSEIVDVSVTGDWVTGRFIDTLVEYRKIQGTILWADTNGDGVLRYTSYSFIQNRSGNGWTSLRFNAFVNGGPEGSYKP